MEMVWAAKGSLSCPALPNNRVDGARHGGDRWIALRLSPDFDDQRRLLPRSQLDMCAQACGDSHEDAVRVGEMDEAGDPLLLVARAKALDGRFLGGKGSVEVVGAHAVT